MNLLVRYRTATAEKFGYCQILEFGTFKKEKYNFIKKLSNLPDFPTPVLPQTAIFIFPLKFVMFLFFTFPYSAGLMTSLKATRQIEQILKSSLFC